VNACSAVGMRDATVCFPPPFVYSHKLGLFLTSQASSFYNLFHKWFWEGHGFSRAARGPMSTGLQPCGPAPECGKYIYETSDQF
jgi:hypothetical protein